MLDLRGYPFMTCDSAKYKNTFICDSSLIMESIMKADIVLYTFILMRTGELFSQKASKQWSGVLEDQHLFLKSDGSILISDDGVKMLSIESHLSAVLIKDHLTMISSNKKLEVAKEHLKLRLHY